MPSKLTWENNLEFVECVFLKLRSNKPVEIERILVLVETLQLSESDQPERHTASPWWRCNRNLSDSRSQMFSSAIAGLFGHEGRDRLSKLKLRG